MTSTANSVGAALTVATTDILTVAVSKVYHILGITVANIDGTNDVDTTVQWTDSSNADAVTRLAFNLLIAAKDSRSCLVAPLALTAGDKIQASASADSDAEITISYYVEDAA